MEEPLLLRVLQDGVVPDASPANPGLSIRIKVFKRRAAVGTTETPGHFKNASSPLHRFYSQLLGPCQGHTRVASFYPFFISIIDFTNGSSKKNDLFVSQRRIIVARALRYLSFQRRAFA